MTVHHDMPIAAAATRYVDEILPTQLVCLRGRWVEVAFTARSTDSEVTLHFTDGTAERFPGCHAVQIGRRIDPCGGGDMPRREEYLEALYDAEALS